MGHTFYAFRSLTFKLIFFFLLTAVPCTCIHAQGDLLISPMRVVFEGSKRSQEISLANVGKDTASYTISVVNYRMKEDGSFEQIDTPDAGQNFANRFFRFFPRKVTLARNEAQVVKVQLIRTGEMQPGEYRSHLYFRSVPDGPPLGEKSAKKDTAGISIQLTPIFGITTPVIIRVGDYNATVTLSNLVYYTSATDNKPMLHLAFNRTGTMSAYGDLVVNHISPSGKVTQVKTVKGIGIYTPNAVRTFNVELETDKNVDYHSGKLQAIYTMQIGAKSEKTAEADVDLK